MWTPTIGYRKCVKHIDNGDPHFLTFSCYRRLPLLTKNRTREWLVEAVNAARQRHGFHLWAWVNLPEHVHLLIWPPRSQVDPDPRSSKGKIAGILADIKRPVAQKAIQYLEQHAPAFLDRLTVKNRNRTYRRFWQAGSGYDVNVNDAYVLEQIAAYIHLNPVRRGLVAAAVDWYWSSAVQWLDMTAESPCRVDRTLPRQYPTR